MRKAKKILVVDDEVVIRNLLQEALEAKGYSLLTAASGEEALELAAANRFAVIILDLILPGKSGAEVARELTRRSSRSNLIILTGGSASLHDFEEMAQVTAVLTKPFAIAELITEVEKAVREK